MDVWRYKMSNTAVHCAVEPPLSKLLDTELIQLSEICDKEIA